MATITGVEQNKRNKSRYSVYIDHRFFASLDEEVLARNHLQVGMIVDEESLKQVLYEDELRNAFDKSLSYLGYRSRSRKEVTAYLKKKGFSPEVVEKVLERLEDYRFVNDDEFARLWVRERKHGKMVGKRIVNQELQQKGIDKEVIEKALEDITEEDELQKAVRLTEKFLSRYEKLPQKDQAYKTGQALARKGFAWETIRKALRMVMDQGGDEDLEGWE